MEAKAQEFIPASQAAKRLCVSERTLIYWRINGTGPPYYTIGGRYMYESGELDAWVQNNRVVPGGNDGNHELPTG